MASLVQQKQEEQKGLGRPIISQLSGLIHIRAAVLLGAVLVSASSCNDSSESIQVDVPQAVLHKAWVGESPDGRSIVLEVLPPPQDVSNARFSEESMLRDRLDLSSDTTLLRLHLFGLPVDLQDDGDVSVDGSSFHNFGQGPEELPASDRLLWNTVLRGLPTPPPEGLVPLHRSLLIHGEVRPEILHAKAATWRLDNMEISLKLRAWTEIDRSHYFEKATQPLPAKKPLSAKDG